MDTSSQETQPETQPTLPVGWSKRSVEDIRKDLATRAGVPAFDARHPELKPADISIAGPFESRENAAHYVRIRYRSIMTACKPLCDVGKRNKDAYLDVVDAVERLVRELDLKHSKSADRADEGGVDPATGARVYNPSQPKNGQGRTGKKRQRGALGK